MNRAGELSDFGGTAEDAFCSRVDIDDLRSQLGTFLGAIHDDSPGWLAVTSGFLIGKKLHGITRKRFAWPAALNDAIAWIGHEAMIGRDVYHGAVIHQGGRGGGLSPVTTLAAEVDHRRMAVLPEPTLVVQSSPTLRQCYWRLSQPIQADAAKRLLARIGASLDQLLLVPGIPNNRFGGGPRIDVVGCSDAIYDPAELQKSLPDLSADPLAKGWHPLPQLRPSERVGQAAVAVATVAGSSAMKVSVAAVTAAIAVTGMASVGRTPQERPIGIGQPEIRTTEGARVDAPGSSIANEPVFASVAAGAPPTTTLPASDERGNGGHKPSARDHVEDVVAGSQGATEVDSDPGAISQAASEPANEARAILLKLGTTQLEVGSP